MKAAQCLLAAVLFPLAAPAQNLTFSRDIAPIIYQHCSTCHRPGESGPFPLITYEDVKRRAPLIAKVVQSRYMPPWLPEAGYGDFADANVLTNSQIQMIADWVSQGARFGNTSEMPSPPRFTSGWQLGPPDLIVEARQAY